MSSEAPRIVRILEVIKTNYTVGLMYLPLLHNPAYRSALTTHRVVVKQNAELVIVLPGNQYQDVEGERAYHVNLKGNLPEPTPEDLDKAFKQLAHEFGKMLVRNVTLDAYEQLYDYCDSTGQLSALQNQSWYLFARLVRHALTHDQHWGFAERDLQKLPITWRGRTITPEMNGSDVMMEYYGWYEAIELIEDMLTFARKLN